MNEFQLSGGWAVVPSQHPIVFLDTGPLLNMWCRWWKGEPINDPCFTDADVQRITSHKCVAEMHNVFRGRANKKLGECQKNVLRYLGDEYMDATPLRLAVRTGLCRESSPKETQREAIAIAKFRYAQARWQQPPDPALMSRYLIDGGEQQVQEQWEVDQPFREAVHLHQELFDKVDDFLRQYAIRVMPVTEVFAPLLGDWYSLVEQSIIRSEDLEILFAAEVAHADIVITDDEELIADTLSLGLAGHDCRIARPLTFTNFWRPDQYQVAMQRLRAGGLDKQLDEIKSNSLKR